MAGGPKVNMFRSIYDLAKEEGFLKLWKGLSPALQRQLINATLRIGLYQPVCPPGSDSWPSLDPWYVLRKGLQGRAPYDQEDPRRYLPTPLRSTLLGLTSGAIGITCACPTDLVKVRMQGIVLCPPLDPSRWSRCLQEHSWGLHRYHPQGWCLRSLERLHPQPDS